MFNRKCPECDKILTYSTKSNRTLAEKKQKTCMSCAKKGKNCGENNSFYGKTHTKETKEKIGKYQRTEQHKQQAREQLKKVSNKKSVFFCWVKRYGIEIANLKLEVKKHRNRIASSGKNNPMFGKPSPNGSGNGWSGWYKTYYFRSLRELMFLLKYLNNKNTLISAESKSFKISYLDFAGKNRNYFPDFILNNKYLIEIKPKKLHFSISVQAKKQAAELFCSSNNLKYKLLDMNINLKLILQKYEAGDIKFLPKYELKFNEFKNSNGK